MLQIQGLSPKFMFQNIMEPIHNGGHILSSKYKSLASIFACATPRCPNTFKPHFNSLIIYKVENSLCY